MALWQYNRIGILHNLTKSKLILNLVSQLIVKMAMDSDCQESLDF